MNNYPLIRFLIVFIFGIIAQSIYNVPLLLLLIIFSFLLSVLLILHNLYNKRFAELKNIFLLSASLTFGMAYHSSFNQTKVIYPFEKPKISNAKVYGKIEKIELKKKGRIILTVKSDSVRTAEKIDKMNYKLLCSVYDDDKKIEALYGKLAIGNEIVFNGVIQRPRNERNPGEFDYEKYLNERGIIALANIYNADDFLILSSSVSYLPNIIFQIRKEIDSKIIALHNNTTEGLLRGLLLADQRSIDNEIKSDFVNSGAVHVLSVSGLHVGYIVLIFLFAFSRFNITARYILTVVGLLFYMIVTGADAPIFRSTIMALSLLAAPAAGRDYNSLNALAFSAFIILLLNPNELFNPSFQLSFSAMLSLIVLFPPLKYSIEQINMNSKLIKWFLIFSVSCLAAQIGTLPFTLAYFNRLSITSIIANLIVIPLSGSIVGLGILTVLLGFFYGALGTVFASANEFLTYGMYWFVRLMGNENYSYISIHQFSVYDAIIFYLFLAVLFFIWKKFSNTKTKMIGYGLALFTFLFFIRIDNYQLMPEKELSILAVDVGQGDAFIVKFPNGKTALIDAGDATKYFDNGTRVIQPLLDKLDIDKIDYGFISHVDSDHYAGFLSLIKKSKIRYIFKPLLDTNDMKDLRLEKLLTQQKIPFRHFTKKIIRIGNARFYVLNDTTNNYFAPLKSNDRSGMMKLVYGKTSFLFTGDAGVRVEDDYVDKYKSFLKSDVLKAGHHGSKTSTGNQFLSYVKPKLAIISAGVANKFRHPSQTVLQRLQQFKVDVLRTDLTGAILLVSNGYNIEIVDWRQLRYQFIF